jgi:hypothetical protein
MAKNIDSTGEIVFSSASDLTQAQRVSRLAKVGKLKPIRAGIYTTNQASPVETVVQRNWRQIAEHLFPGAVVGYRSGMRGGPEGGKVFLVHGDRAKRVNLPGLELVIVPGAPAITDGIAPDAQYGKLFVSSEPRRLLENLTMVKGAKERAVGREGVETELDKILSIRGEVRLNALRDAASEVASKAGLEREFERLNKIISALLTTHDAKILKSKAAIARASGTPYDPARMPRFDALFQALHTHIFNHPADGAPDGIGLENFSFFESYFSNFIEGTEFTIEEAEDIIFDGRIIENRSEDSHDIQGTFQTVIGPPWRNYVSRTEEEFKRAIRTINAIIMQSRQDKNPGEWKNRANQAGSSIFVAPELVHGTLKEGFERVRALTDPVARALMTMFIISEVHPFTDGNGRTARIAMNACLTDAGLSRIIIPTVYREDYLLPLKALTNHIDPEAYIRSMSKAHAWSALIDWYQPRKGVQTALVECNAFQEDLKNFKLLLPDTKVARP